MNCSERCSGHCIDNKTCDHVSGECSDGCLDGYIGIFCNDSKIQEYNCSIKNQFQRLFFVFVFNNPYCIKFLCAHQRALTDITDQTVPKNASQTVELIDTQTECVLVMKVG